MRQKLIEMVLYRFWIITSLGQNPGLQSRNSFDLAHATIGIPRVAFVQINAKCAFWHLAGAVS